MLLGSLVTCNIYCLGTVEPLRGKLSIWRGSFSEKVCKPLWFFWALGVNVQRLVHMTGYIHPTHQHCSRRLLISLPYGVWLDRTLIPTSILLYCHQAENVTHNVWVQRVYACAEHTTINDMRM